MHPRVPFMMVARQQYRLLGFFEANESIRTAGRKLGLWIIILGQISPGGISVDGPEINRIVRSDLLLELQRDFLLIQIVIFKLARISVVKYRKGIPEFPGVTVLRCGLRPGPTAQILSAGRQVKAVSFEELRVFL